MPLSHSYLHMCRILQAPFLSILVYAIEHFHSFPAPVRPAGSSGTVAPASSDNTVTIIGGVVAVLIVLIIAVTIIIIVLFLRNRRGEFKPNKR